MAPPPVLDRLVRLLVGRHALSPDEATAMVGRAAHRKGVTMQDVAAYVMDEVPLPRPVNGGL